MDTIRSRDSISRHSCTSQESQIHTQDNSERSSDNSNVELTNRLSHRKPEKYTQTELVTEKTQLDSSPRSYLEQVAIKENEIQVLREQLEKDDEKIGKLIKTNENLEDQRERLIRLTRRLTDTERCAIDHYYRNSQVISEDSVPMMNNVLRTMYHHQQQQSSRPSEHRIQTTPIVVGKVDNRYHYSSAADGPKQQRHDTNACDDLLNNVGNNHFRSLSAPMLIPTAWTTTTAHHQDVMVRSRKSRRCNPSSTHTHRMSDCGNMKSRGNKIYEISSSTSEDSLAKIEEPPIDPRENGKLIAMNDALKRNLERLRINMKLLKTENTNLTRSLQSKTEILVELSRMLDIDENRPDLSRNITQHVQVLIRNERVARRNAEKNASNFNNQLSSFVDQIRSRRQKYETLKRSKKEAEENLLKMGAETRSMEAVIEKLKKERDILKAQNKKFADMLRKRDFIISSKEREKERLFEQYSTSIRELSKLRLLARNMSEELERLKRELKLKPSKDESNRRTKIDIARNRNESNNKDDGDDGKEEKEKYSLLNSTMHQQPHSKHRHHESRLHARHPSTTSTDNRKPSEDGHYDNQSTMVQTECFNITAPGESILYTTQARHSDKVRASAGNVTSSRVPLTDEAKANGDSRDGGDRHFKLNAIDAITPTRIDIENTVAECWVNTTIPSQTDDQCCQRHPNESVSNGDRQSVVSEMCNSKKPLIRHRLSSPAFGINDVSGHYQHHRCLAPLEFQIMNGNFKHQVPMTTTMRF